MPCIEFLQINFNNFLRNYKQLKFPYSLVKSTSPRIDKDLIYTVLKVNSEPFSLLVARRSGSLLKCNVNTSQQRTNDGRGDPDL